MNSPDLTLYLVTNSGGRSESEFIKAVENACLGGVTMVQLREKKRCGRDFLELAKKVKAVTDKFDIPLIINDRVDIALACGAAGVHLGSEDMPIADARRIMGKSKMIGATAKTVSAAVSAERDGANYLGVGAIFPTTTKDTKLTDTDTLKKICLSVNIPVCAIGGLAAENCGILAGSGISGIAVVSAVMGSSDPEKAARELRIISTGLMSGNTEGIK